MDQRARCLAQLGARRDTEGTAGEVGSILIWSQHERGRPEKFHVRKRPDVVRMSVNIARKEQLAYAR
jgi:hypothetical protein